MLKTNAKKKRIKQMVIIAAVLMLVLLWLLIWQLVGKRMQHAATDAQYTHFTYNGAIYARCADAAAYYDLTLSGDMTDCGESIGTVQFTVDNVTVYKEAYRVNGEEKHPIAEPVLLVQQNEKCLPYELAGFTALNESPSITAVCAAYGIQSAQDIASVTVYDADGSVVQTLTNAEALATFYDKFIALGQDIGAAGQSQAYYDVYVEKYGASDAITLKDGIIETADDETYQQALELWGAGMCSVTMQLQNGLRIADMVYAPVPKVFQVYGYYTITTPFFE